MCSSAQEEATSAGPTTANGSFGPLPAAHIRVRSNRSAMPIPVNTVARSQVGQCRHGHWLRLARHSSHRSAEASPDWSVTPRPASVLYAAAHGRGPACLPFLVLAMGTVLAHMLRADAEATDTPDCRTGPPAVLRSLSWFPEDQARPDRRRPEADRDRSARRDQNGPAPGPRHGRGITGPGSRPAQPQVDQARVPGERQVMHGHHRLDAGTRSPAGPAREGTRSCSRPSPRSPRGRGFCSA